MNILMVSTIDDLCHYSSQSRSKMYDSYLTCEYSSDGVIANVICITRDITKHKQAEEMLRSTKDNSQIIMDAMPIGIAVTDGILIEYLNKNFIERFGYTLDEIPTDQQWFLRAYPDSKYREMLISTWRAALDETRKSGCSVPTMEVNITCKDGTIRHALANTQLIQNHILIIFTDITEREIAQREFAKIQKLESLGVLAGGMAHDFNNILTSIMGNISISKRLVDKNHAVYNSLETAEKASLRAAELVRKFMVFTKGGQPIKKRVSLQKVVNEAVSLVLSGTNIISVIDIPTTLNIIMADEGQINQSFHNLIINAVHSMPDGGRLTVSGENVILNANDKLGLPDGNYIKISFEDEGCGISESDQKRIFEPYFTTKVSGTGLGLASTYSIINKHGGHISVRSSVGIGTIFTIYLPSLKNTILDQYTNIDSPIINQDSGSILVMDDDEMIRDLLVTMLVSIGYTVVACSSGNEAIELYKLNHDGGQPFSFVIMDLTIPGGMGGVEAARCILEIDPTALLIASSGYSDSAIMANCQTYGFCSIIRKPYRIEDVAMSLNRVKKNGCCH